MNKLETQRDLTHVINRAIRWRTGLQEKYPNDPRLAIAVELLQKLAVESEAFTDAQFKRVEPYASWTDQHWRDSIQTVARRVGYQPYLTTFERYIDVLSSLLSRPKVAA